MHNKKFLLNLSH